MCSSLEINRIFFPFALNLFIRILLKRKLTFGVTDKWVRGLIITLFNQDQLLKTHFSLLWLSRAEFLYVFIEFQVLQIYMNYFDQ